LSWLGHVLQQHGREHRYAARIGSRSRKHLDFHCPLPAQGVEPEHLGLFNSHHRLAAPVEPWARLKIGAGTPPVLTQHGWLGLLTTLESFANEGGLLPEQVWDSPDIPERELHFGRPSGSAMPLVWAHAEYLKLRRSLRDGRLFDLPPQTVQRYLTEKTVSPRMWRFNHKIRSVPAGKILRIETMAASRIHWSADDWKSVQDVSTHDTGSGLHIVDLPTAELPESAQVRFTFYWPAVDRWEGADFMVRIADRG
jgi:hypothetical protein